MIQSLKAKLGELVWRRKVRRFCAIDLDSRHVRIVQAEQTAGGVRMLKLATADLPADLDVSDAAGVGAFLGRTLAQMHMAGTAIVMDVPRGQAVLKALVLPPVATTGELAGMVQYQAEKELTFRPSEAVVDFTLEAHYGAELPEEQAEGEHVLVAAVRKPVVEYYQQVAQAAGVRLLRLGLRPYANIRAVQTYGRHEMHGRLAVIHITAEEAEIDVCESGALAFSRAAVLKIPAAGERTEGDLAEATLTVVTEVARSLHSYLGVERGTGIDAVLVAGGTGIEQRVVDELARRLNVRAEMLNPADALGLEDTGPAASAFISALGLALGQAADAELPFNFLSPKRAPVQRDTRKLLAVSGLAALVFVLVTAFAMAAYNYYEAKVRVDDLTAQYNKLKDENKRVTALANRIKAIDDWVGAGRNWLDQWAYLSAVFPSCVDTYVTSLKTNPDGSASFSVKARTSDAIKTLSSRLETAGYDSKPYPVITTQDPYGYGYSTSVKVNVKPNMKVDLAVVNAEPRPEDDGSAEAFGRPPGAKAETTAKAGTPAAPAEGAQAAAPGSVEALTEKYKAWQAQYNAFNQTRPPESEAQAVEAWRAKRSEIRAEGEAIQKEIEVARRAAAQAHQQQPGGPQWRRRQ